MGIGYRELLLLLAVFLPLSLVPFWIAASRRHPNKYAILALGVLLGWTGGGWLAALIWAFLPPSANQATKRCPYCAETIKAEAVICRYCNRNLPTEAATA